MVDVTYVCRICKNHCTLIIDDDCDVPWACPYGNGECAIWRCAEEDLGATTDEMSENRYDHTGAGGA